jgi:hypothetical protein
LLRWSLVWGVEDAEDAAPGKILRCCAESEDLAACQKNMQIKSWYKSGNNFDPTYAKNCQQLSGRYQAECKAMLVKDLAIQRRDASI